MLPDLRRATTRLRMLSPKTLIARVVLAGLVVGALDITATCASAYVTKGTPPPRILRYVASGLLGRYALSGGTGTAALGLLLHFIIALGWTALFFVAYPRVRLLSHNRVIAGIGYGAFVWAVMQFLVVPLSRTPQTPFNAVATAKQLLIHVLMIGLPISLFAHRHHRKRARD